MEKSKKDTWVKRKIDKSTKIIEKMAANSPSRNVYLTNLSGNAAKIVKILPTSNGAGSSASSKVVHSVISVQPNSTTLDTANRTNQFRLSQLGAISNHQSSGAGGGGGSTRGVKRSAQSDDTPTPPPAQRSRKSDKSGKGLRHFSMRVCEKLEEKGTTTYNEVADELVAEETAGSTAENAQYDQKNIRRRVYDALNVLMAMNIISKEKKEIRWIGLPTNSIQECQELEKENRERRKRIEAKQLQLKQLILQQVAFTSLVNRNKEAEERGQQPSLNSAIQLPFIIVNTNKKTHINCSISNDKSEYSFKFDDKFEIHDDIDVLKKMGLLQGLDKGECAMEDIEKFKRFVPKSLQKYIETYGKGVDEGPGVLKDEDDEDDEAAYSEPESSDVDLSQF